MRSRAVLILFFLARAGLAHADSAQTEIRAIINRQASAIASVNASTFTADWVDGGSIIDVFPPYLWTGPGFQERWFKDFSAGVASGGLTNFRVSLKKAIQIAVTDDVAYAVIPTSVSYDQKGRRMHENGTWTATFKHIDAGWRISAWAWGGGMPIAQ